MLFSDEDGHLHTGDIVSIRPGQFLTDTKRPYVTLTRFIGLSGSHGVRITHHNTECGVLIDTLSRYSVYEPTEDELVAWNTKYGSIDYGVRWQKTYSIDSHHLSIPANDHSLF